MLFVLEAGGDDGVSASRTYRFEAVFCQYCETGEEADAEQAAEDCNVRGPRGQFVEDCAGADDGGAALAVHDGSDVGIPEEAVGALKGASLCDAPLVVGEPSHFAGAAPPSPALTNPHTVRPRLHVGGNRPRRA